MPLIAFVFLCGFGGSAVLAFVVACGWVSLCARAYDAENPDRIYGYESQRDFGNAFGPSFVCGMVMTVAGLVVAHATGADVWTKLGG